jgi:hypothetical protein
MRRREPCGKIKAWGFLVATLAGVWAGKAHALPRPPRAVSAPIQKVSMRAGSEEVAAIVCGSPHRDYGLQYHHAFRRFAATNGNYWRHIVKDSPLPVVLRLPDFSAARPPLFHPPD